MSGDKKERSYLPTISEPGKATGADIVIPVYYDEQELALFPLDYYPEASRGAQGNSHSDDMRNLKHEVIMPTERAAAEIKSFLDLLKEGISYLETHIADEGLSDEVRSNLAASKGLAEEIRGIYRSMRKTTSKTITLAQDWHDRIEAHCG